MKKPDCKTLATVQFLWNPNFETCHPKKWQKVTEKVKESLARIWHTCIGIFCSDRTDVESTHSSNISAHKGDRMHTTIPPDALYGTIAKGQAKFAYVDAADFNDSKVRNNTHMPLYPISYSYFFYCVPNSHFMVQFSVRAICRSFSNVLKVVQGKK